MRCNYYVAPVEKPFVRPKSSKKVTNVSNTVLANPLVTTATPATLYALGKGFMVDTGMLKVKEVVIDFNSSGSVPKLEAEDKASTAKLVNFVSTAPKIVVIVDELGFEDEEEEESSEPSKNQV